MWVRRPSRQKAQQSRQARKDAKRRSFFWIFWFVFDPRFGFKKRPQGTRNRRHSSFFVTLFGAVFCKKNVGLDPSWQLARLLGALMLYTSVATVVWPLGALMLHTGVAIRRRRSQDYSGYSGPSFSTLAWLP